MTDNEMLKAIYTDMQEMKRQIKDIQLTLENETNRNIKIIAEGHLDLSRKLDDALKVDNEKEMLLIRVNSLENEVRKLKERISSIAWIIGKGNNNLHELFLQAHNLTFQSSGQLLIKKEYDVQARLSLHLWERVKSGNDNKSRR